MKTKQILHILVLMLTFNGFGKEIINVKVDKRIEAISIFYTLATRDTLDAKPTPSKYYKDFDSYFEKYKNHQSLDWYRNLNKWDAYDLSSIGLYLSEKYPFKLDFTYNGKQLKSCNIDLFLQKFNLFYSECKVEKFIKVHEKDYENISKFAKKAIIKSGVLDEINIFYSKSTDDEVLIFVDILNNIGNNAIEINHKKFKNMKIFKLAYLNDNTKTFNSEVKFIPLSNVVIHEISHLFLSDFIPNNLEYLIKKKHLFLINSKNESLKEVEWKNELDELLVRVCVSKILGKRFGNQKEMSEIENQSKHFRYFKVFNELFEEYSNNRAVYKDINEFYPEILKLIGTLYGMFIEK